MKRFIIDRLDDGINQWKIDSMLLNCILEVVHIHDDGNYLTLQFNDFDGTVKHIAVHKNVGEFYDEEVSLRRKKDLAIQNIISMMNYNNVSLDELQKHID